MGMIMRNGVAFGGGSSLPSGGTTGQVLTKHSATDGDVEWTTPADLTNYYTKTEVDARINAAITSALSASY